MENKAPIQLMSVKKVAATGILSESALRAMLKQGLCPGVVYIGKKALINVGRLIEELNSADEIHVDPKKQANTRSEISGEAYLNENGSRDNKEVNRRNE